MAENTDNKKILNGRVSHQYTTTKDNSPSDLEMGEIAVHAVDGYESIIIKNRRGENTNILKNITEPIIKYGTVGGGNVNAISLRDNPNGEKLIISSHKAPTNKGYPNIVINNKGSLNINQPHLYDSNISGSTIEDSNISASTIENCSVPYGKVLKFSGTTNDYTAHTAQINCDIKINNDVLFFIAEGTTTSKIGEGKLPHMFSRDVLKINLSSGNTVTLPDDLVNLKNDIEVDEEVIAASLNAIGNSVGLNNSFEYSPKLTDPILSGTTSLYHAIVKLSEENRILKEEIKTLKQAVSAIV